MQILSPVLGRKTKTFWFFISLTINLFFIINFLCDWSEKVVQTSVEQERKIPENIQKYDVEKSESIQNKDIKKQENIENNVIRNQDNSKNNEIENQVNRQKAVILPRNAKIVEVIDNAEEVPEERNIKYRLAVVHILTDTGNLELGQRIRQERFDFLNVGSNETRGFSF